MLRLMRQHLTYKEIAQRLGISWHTVRTHAQSILRKSGVHSRRDLAAWDARAGAEAETAAAARGGDVIRRRIAPSAGLALLLAGGALLVRVAVMTLAGDSARHHVALHRRRMRAGRGRPRAGRASPRSPPRGIAGRRTSPHPSCRAGDGTRDRRGPSGGRAPPVAD